ncbi:MAG: hypothetical protein AAB374_00355 [Patescibacteria group bacterium]
MKPLKLATILRRWTFGKTSNGTSSQKGSVIIFTLLILGSMLAITLALASIYLPKIRAISDAGAGSVGAIYAADSALEWCIYTNRANPALSQPTMSNGATYTILPNVANTCTTLPLNNQVIGTYRSVSRSLQVTTP